MQASFTTFWTPLAFRWKAQNESTQKFEMVSDGIAGVMTLLLILILIFKQVIPIFLGVGYEVAIYIMPFLLFYPIFYTMSETTAVGISFSKKTYYNIIISAASMLVNILLNALLIPKFGAIGAATATGISYLTFFWTRTIISKKLWYPLKTKRFIITTIILMSVALANSFIKNIYIITAINMSCLIINIINYRYLIKMLIDYKKKNKIV